MPQAAFLGPFQPVPAAAGAPVPGGNARRLGLTMPRPAPTEWCWAATASAVCTYFAGLGFGSAATPCEIATEWLMTPCCPEPDDPHDTRNTTFALESPLQSHGHLAAAPINAAIGFDAIVNQINNGRPVCCHIAWTAEGPDQGHYNVIVGYDPSNQDVDVCDCLYAETSLPYETFRTGYQGSGTWDWSYLTTGQS